MKTAISISDNLYNQANRLARKTGKSRSQIFAEALQDYLARHSPEEVTDAMNRVLEDVDKTPDAFVQRAAHLTLERTEW